MEQKSQDYGLRDARPGRGSEEVQDSPFSNAEGRAVSRGTRWPRSMGPGMSRTGRNSGSKEYRAFFIRQGPDPVKKKQPAGRRAVVLQDPVFLYNPAQEQP